jgi:branched-chain amino acid aminotransferase
LEGDGMSEKGMPRYVWMDGKIVPFEDAKIHVFTPAAKYGTAPFEGLRAYWNEEKEELYSFRTGEHYERLFESLKIMRLKITYSVADCKKFLVETIRANDFKEDLHIRHTVYLGGYSMVDTEGPTGMWIIARPLGRLYDMEKGIRCSISSWVRMDDNSFPPRVKIGSNYQNSILAAAQARADGYDQPIMLDSRGKVSESATACLFMVRRGVIVTPPVTSSILESITRTTIIEMARHELNLPVEERDIDRTELYVSEEAFLCGSGLEVTPVTSIDKIPVGNGKVGPTTKKIVAAYFDIVRGNKPKYKEWLTPIYGA